MPSHYEEAARQGERDELKESLEHEGKILPQKTSELQSESPEEKAKQAQDMEEGNYLQTSTIEQTIQDIEQQLPTVDNDIDKSLYVVKLIHLKRALSLAKHGVDVIKAVPSLAGLLSKYK